MPADPNAPPYVPVPDYRPIERFWPYVDLPEQPFDVGPQFGQFGHLLVDTPLRRAEQCVSLVQFPRAAVKFLPPLTTSRAEAQTPSFTWRHCASPPVRRSRGLHST